MTDTERIAELEARVDGLTRALDVEIAEREKAEAALALMTKAEHELSSAYLRLRKFLNAFDTPPAPTNDFVWAHTESKLLQLKAQLATETEARLANDNALNSFMKKMVRCENCEGSGLISNHVSGEVECSMCSGTGWSSALVLELAETRDELADVKRELGTARQNERELIIEICRDNDCYRAIKLIEALTDEGAK